MKLSRRSDYALRALLALAEVPPGDRPLSVRELSENHDIPRKFLEAIMADLRHLGFVESLAGKRGGYRLALPPDQISLGAVIRHFDALLEGEQSSQPVDTGDFDADRLHRALRAIGGELERLMDEMTLANVLRGEQLPRDGAHDELFIHGHGI